MNLLIIPSWYPTSIHPESGTFFKDRAKILQGAGFSVTIAAHILHPTKDILRFEQNKNKIEKTYDDDIIIYKTESINPFPKMPKKTFSFYKKSITRLIETVIYKSKPDFVFINSSIYGGAALAKYFNDKKIPFMVSEHLKEFIIDDEFSSFHTLCINECYNYCSKIIATSKILKKNIIKKFNVDTNKITLIPNPADTEIFLPKKGKTSGPFSFITIALFRPEKRLDILIKSFAKLFKNNPNIVLTIIGDGAEKDKLTLLSHKLNVNKRINFIGYQKKSAVSDILRNHDAFVLTSEVETFGVAIVEAMSVGLPVVATKCGGPESIVLPETGILVEKNDENKLCAAMGRIINNYDNYESSVIRKIALKTYGDKPYANKIRNAINSVLLARD